MILLCNCSKPKVVKTIDTLVKDSSFALVYEYYGLGRSQMKNFPFMQIDGTQLLILIQKKTYYDTFPSKIDTIMIRQIPFSFRDSIYNCLSGWKDTNIKVTNDCIIGGAYHHLTMRQGEDTVKITMQNTAHPTALKITKILNKYLPYDHQIGLREKMIQDEEECWKWFQKNLLH